NCKLPLFVKYPTQHTHISFLFVKAVLQYFRITSPFFEILLPKFAYMFKRIYLFETFLPESEHRPIQDFNRFFDIFSFTEFCLIYLFIHFFFSFFIVWLLILLNTIILFSIYF